jgi:hypothetical protein
MDNIAECFCCKKKGLILVFPKKGKPKALGSANQIAVCANGASAVQ